MPSTSTYIKATALAVVVAAALFIDKKQAILKVLSLMESVESIGYLGPVIWIAWLTVSQIVMVPTTGMEVLGGFMFGNSLGWWIAFATCFAGKMGGMALTFFLARYFLGDWTRKNIIAQSTMLSAVFRAVEREGFKMVIIARFAPVPTGAKNYGLAAGTTVGFWTIFLASGIAGCPYSALAVSLGMTAHSALDILDGKIKLSMPSSWAIAAIIFSVPAVVYVLITCKRSYQEVVAKETAAVSKETKKQN